MIGQGSKAKAPHFAITTGDNPIFAPSFTKNSGTTILVAKFSNVNFARNDFNLHQCSGALLSNHLTITNLRFPILIWDPDSGKNNGSRTFSSLTDTPP